METILKLVKRKLIFSSVLNLEAIDFIGKINFGPQNVFVTCEWNLSFQPLMWYEFGPGIS